MPDSCLVNTILPIPKGRNANTSDSSNFRGIVLCSVYGKLFDNIVLNRCSDRLMTTGLQFGGFKTKSSTNMCTMVLKEAIAYYLKNQSSVFCTFLDASKTFYRVRYCKLFDLLIKRNLPAYIIKVYQLIFTPVITCNMGRWQYHGSAMGERSTTVGCIIVRLLSCP